MRTLVIGVLAIGAAAGYLAPRPQALLEEAKVDAPATVHQIRTEPPRPAPTAPSGETVLTRQPDGHFYAELQVNGHPVRFLIDTGASGIALTREDAERAGIAVDPSRFEVVGSGASGPVRGQRVRLDDLRLDLKQASAIDAAVLDDGLDISLLGQSFLARYATVQIEGDRMLLR